jgi:sulfite reductase beta subunit-like hemoprotein
LPRKFNIAFDGGGLIGTVEDTNDIGLKAVRIDEPQKSGDIEMKPGIYFRVSLGGATGHKTFARDLGVLVQPEQLLKVVVALIRVYIANGNRSDRKRARLKHLLETWTLEKYLEETEKVLGYNLFRAPADAVGADVRRSLKFYERQPPPSALWSYPYRGLSPKAERIELHRRHIRSAKSAETNVTSRRSG